MNSRLSLATLPTPLHRMDRLSEREGADLWVKRDDLTGFALSGNKVRKLEWLLADAAAQGADTVLTTGGLQSNHCRATAVACRQRGLHPVLLLRGSPVDEPDSNLLIDTLLGAELVFCTPEEYRTRRNERLAELAEGVRERGGVPYVIPEGGSNALGSQGYVHAAQEVALQAETPFDSVVVAVGSGGTLAGLAMGVDLGPVVGFAVCDDQPTFEGIVHRIHAEAVDRGLAGPFRSNWRVDDRYRGAAYAVADEAVWRTIADIAQLEGLLLDPVYTGKAMHGLLSELRAGRLGRRVLFWHTGGAFGLFGRGRELTC